MKKDVWTIRVKTVSDAKVKHDSVIGSSTYMWVLPRIGDLLVWNAKGKTYKFLISDVVHDATKMTIFLYGELLEELGL